MQNVGFLMTRLICSFCHQKFITNAGQAGVLVYQLGNSRNKNTKMSSFKVSKNIQKKESGPDRSVSDNQSSSVTLNKLAIKARKPYYNFELQK